MHDRGALPVGPRLVVSRLLDDGGQEKLCLVLVQLVALQQELSSQSCDQGSLDAKALQNVFGQVLGVKVVGLRKSKDTFINQSWPEVQGSYRRSHPAEAPGPDLASCVGTL